jgi:type IV secretion system protein VirD4
MATDLRTRIAAGVDAARRAARMSVSAVREHPDRLDVVARHNQRAARRIQDDPAGIGWRIGKAVDPPAGDIFVPYDRTSIVYGPQGSGKTLDCLAPTLLKAPGAAVVTLTKPDDMFLTYQARSKVGPAVVCDPFGLAPSLPILLWDPIRGCEDARQAMRRAKAFTYGTIKLGSGGDSGARFYREECQKVLSCYLHAAALGKHTLADMLDWVTNPRAAAKPSEILLNHPQATRGWYGRLRGALFGDDGRTSSNTIVTVQQAMSMFAIPDQMRRCVPSPERPATDVYDVIAKNGTFYLLAIEDELESVSPYLTALTEYILDTAREVAHDSEFGRLAPPMLACLDELPSTAPIPTLRSRMANDRALGICYLLATQTRAQLDDTFGPKEARAIVALANVQVTFGGSTDPEFNKQIAELAGTARVPRETWSTRGGGGGSQISGEDMPVIKPDEVRLIPDRHVIVIAEKLRPVLAKTYRCIDGPEGRTLLAAQAELRSCNQAIRKTQTRPDPASEHADTPVAPAEPDEDPLEAGRRIKHDLQQRTRSFT